MSWMEFDSFQTLGKWIVSTKAGQRFFAWFARKYFRELLSTEVGMAFYDWMHERVLKEVTDDREQKFPHIVIETFPDGYLKVYGKDVGVSFINRLSVQTAAAEVLDEQRCELGATHRQKEVYLHKVLATEHIGLHPTTVAELLDQKMRMDIHASLDRFARDKSRPAHEAG